MQIKECPPISRTTSKRILYELTGVGDQRFSPYCWRIRAALEHKNLDYTTVPVKFTEKSKIAFSNQKKVPILVDNGEVISDSWQIAVYLEETYPSAPELFGSQQAQQLSRLINIWIDRELHPPILRGIIGDLYAHVDHLDRDYFRESREARLGATIERLTEIAPTEIETASSRMLPFLTRLQEKPYLSGDTPAYADYILFGTLTWCHLTSQARLFDSQSPLAKWYSTLADRFNVPEPI